MKNSILHEKSSALVKEIKSSPSSKKTFYYYPSNENNNKLNVVQDKDTTKRITSLTRAIRTFILVSN